MLELARDLGECDGAHGHERIAVADEGVRRARGEPIALDARTLKVDRLGGDVLVVLDPLRGQSTEQPLIVRKRGGGPSCRGMGYLRYSTRDRAASSGSMLRTSAAASREGWETRTTPPSL